MTPLILAGMALVFARLCGRPDRRRGRASTTSRGTTPNTRVLHSRGTALKRILAQPVAHMRALRFWRVWFEMASAVAVTVLLHSLLDNVWLAGLAATGIMAVVGFVIVGVSPAPARPGALRRPGRASPRR